MRKIKYSLSRCGTVVNARKGVTRLEVITLILIAIVFGGLIVTFISRFADGQSKSLRRQPPPHRLGHPRLSRGEEVSAARPHRADFATWPVVIAPYLQKDSGLENWNLTKRFADQSEKAREAVLSAYFCPSRSRDVLQSVPDASPGHDPVRGTLGDYACASGDGDHKKPWTGPLANGAMILGEALEGKDDLLLKWKSRTTLASLMRGQSYTLLVGEKHVPLDKLGQPEQGDGSIYNGGHPASSARIGGPGFGLAGAAVCSLQHEFRQRPRRHLSISAGGRRRTGELCGHVGGGVGKDYSERVVIATNRSRRFGGSHAPLLPR